jgi:putative transposase
MQSTGRKAYQYRFYPTEAQARELARTFGCVRYVYNWALALRTEAWFERHERIDYAETDRLLVRMKKDPEKSWLADVSCVPLQQALRHLKAAFVNFFAGRAKYPRFKRKHGRQSATYRIGGFRWKNGVLTLAKMDEPLNIRWTEQSKVQGGGPYRFIGEPTSVTISKDPDGRYFVSFLVEEEIAPLPVVNATVGIDLGLLDAVAMSTGEKVGNERFFRQDEKRLALAQGRLARKQKGSRNREKARCKVARIHARIANRRRDVTHKLTTRIIRENQAVCAESLNVKGMLAHPAG